MVGGLLVMTSAAPAAANVPSGSRSQTRSPGGTGLQSWGYSTRSVSLAAQAGRLAQHYCLDSWFDWTSSAGHFDARVVRNCRSGITHNASWREGLSAQVTGMQKAATCYSVANSPLLASECTNATGASIGVAGNVQPSLPNYCTGASVRNANNTISVYSGGTSTSCTS